MTLYDYQNILYWLFAIEYNTLILNKEFNNNLNNLIKKEEAENILFNIEYKKYFNDNFDRKILLRKITDLLLDDFEER